MAVVKTYRATYERGEDGYWVVDVPGLRGAHTQGRTLASARERVFEAIELMRDGTGPFEVEDSVLLPSALDKALASALEARSAAEDAANEAHEKTTSAATKLIDAGLSVRDAASLLGLSHGRVHQLVHAP